MAPLTLLIPAAGASLRMRGGDKLLELVDGVPMLRHQARLARAVCDRVLVALRPNDAARRAVIRDLALTLIDVADAETGMAASVRAGAARCAGRAMMILPADMPELTLADLRAVIGVYDQKPNQIIRATAQDGTPGHPVIFPPDCLPMLRVVQGDEGARSVLAANRHRIHLIALPDQHALTDLDTPEDWANWRSNRSLTGKASNDDAV